MGWDRCGLLKEEIRENVVGWGKCEREMPKKYLSNSKLRVGAV